jgi:hypothetical protein
MHSAKGHRRAVAASATIGALCAIGGLAAAPADAQPGASIPGDGTYVVGSDIGPGVYVSAATGNGCYWERLSGLSGTFNDIIANGSSAGQQYVQIAPSDVAFSTQGCSKWKLAGGAAPVAAPAIAGFPKPIPDGTPGLYPGDPCSQLHATSQDGIGQTVWCNPLMTGDHSLRWMYGGPS